MKILSFVIFAIFMVMGSAWGLDSSMSLNTSGNASVRWDSWEDRKEMRENSIEIRQQLRELNGAIRDYRVAYRKDMADARADCDTMVQSETSENMKNTVRAECEAEIKLLRDALRENIISLYNERYSRLVAAFRLQMNSAVGNYFHNLSASEKVEFMAGINTRLNAFEDNANQNRRDTHVLWVAAIRAVLEEWKENM